MMKNSKICLCLVYALLAAGFGYGASDAQRPPVVFRHQFVGAQAVGSLAKVPKAVELLSSTNGVAFRKLVSERFAKWLAAGAGKSDGAAVNGLAFGGGFELALAADLIVAADTAEFALTEVTLGIMADAGGVLRLPKRLPLPIAMEMLMTARRMGADEALRWGLVNKVVAKADLMTEARALAQTVAANAPLALKAIKAVIKATLPLDVKAGYALMRSSAIPPYDAMIRSEDALEGPLAFSEKRKPEWKGK